MNHVLLDTQTLVWSLLDERRLSPAANTALQGADSVFVSVVSIYEVEFKRRDPRRRRAQDALLLRMPADMPSSLPKLGLQLLLIDAHLADAAARLPIDHGDPWDRILLAQALPWA